MSVILFIAIILGALILLLSLVGSLQPRLLIIESSRVIPIAQLQVFDAIQQLRTYPKWDPWSTKAPGLIPSFSYFDDAIGSTYSWQGNLKTGSGKLEIVSMDAPHSLTLAIQFGFQHQATATFRLAPEKEETHVTWIFETDLGANPIRRVALPYLKKYIQSDLNLGLEQLKTYLQHEANETH
jgi:hypothetical protein